MMVQTNDPRMQPDVDMVNDLMARSHRYRMKRHQAEMNPDFSNVRWYFGMAQKRAIGICCNALASTDFSHNGSKFMDFPVTWVAEDYHAELCEVAG